MQKLFEWSYGYTQELKDLLDDGWRVVMSTRVKDNHIHYILEKVTRKEKLEYLKEITDENKNT